MTTPSRDEFAAWAADPVTAFVMDGLRALAGQQFEAFQADAWGCKSEPDSWQALRIYRERCKSRVECWTDLTKLTIEDAYGANGLEAPPKTEETGA